MKKSLFNIFLSGSFLYLFLSHASIVGAANLASEFTKLPCTPTNNANLTITGGPSNLPLRIGTSTNSAGAISSLTVNGTETVDTHDHGRLIQYAMFIGGGIWDPNPTEAGSGYDGDMNHPSSSKFLEGCHTGNTLYTKSQMAYWLKVDGAKLSPYVVSKIVQIGVGNMPNLIRFTTKIHAPSGVANKLWLFNDPALYFKYYFNKLSLFDISTQTSRTPGQSEFTKEADHNVYYIPYYQFPVVSNGQYSLVPYIADNTYGPITSYSYAEYPGATVQDNMNVTIPTLKPGDYYFESYLLVSPNTTVVKDMKTLANAIPQKNHVPVGHIDGITDGGIVHGWAADKDKDQISVRISLTDAAGAQAFVGSVLTNDSRPDVLATIGYGAKSGFTFQIPAQYRTDSKKYTINARAFDYNTSLNPNVNILLEGSGAPFSSTKPVKLGDLNGDRKIDMSDFTIFKNDFGKTGTAGFILSDIDKNGVVDIFDYNILVGNFGK